VTKIARLVDLIFNKNKYKLKIIYVGEGASAESCLSCGSGKLFLYEKK
jgi:hypothetical protein